MTEPVEQIIGANIRRLRDKESQTDFGRRLAVLTGKPWSTQLVSAAENGKRSFIAADIIALTHALHCAVQDLYSGTDIYCPVIPEVPARTIGRNVRMRRGDFGYTQTHLARRMQAVGFKWTQTIVAKLERDARPVFGDELVALAAIFDCTIDALVGRTTQPDWMSALANQEKMLHIANEALTKISTIKRGQHHEL